MPMPMPRSTSSNFPTNCERFLLRDGLVGGGWAIGGGRHLAAEDALVQPQSRGCGFGLGVHDVSDKLIPAVRPPSFLLDPIDLDRHDLARAFLTTCMADMHVRKSCGSGTTSDNTQPGNQHPILYILIRVHDPTLVRCDCPPGALAATRSSAPSFCGSQLLAAHRPLCTDLSSALFGVSTLTPCLGTVLLGQHQSGLHLYDGGCNTLLSHRGVKMAGQIKESPHLCPYKNHLWS